jgi:corrinoid protein of di/trimethylamine methyltransferase
MKMSELSETQKALLDELHDAVINGDEVRCKALALETYEVGIPPLDVIEICLSPALREVGEAFNRMDVFLPEMLVCAETMQVAVQVLEPYFNKMDQKTSGVVILGTVKGDIHDIGKNIFKALLEVNGFEVVDIGRDVAPTVFIDEAVKREAQFIAMSGLLSTSLAMMRDTIQILIDDGIRDQFKVIIGGGPTSQLYADKIGADGYADTAYDGVKLCNKLLGLD